MTELLGDFTRWLAEYFDEMSIMLVATALVVYGDVINKHVKRILAPYHFVIRTLVFVLLCAFGYGLLTLYGAPFLRYVLAYLPWQYQGAAYVMCFITLGFLAERRRYI